MFHKRYDGNNNSENNNNGSNNRLFTIIVIAITLTIIDVIMIIESGKVIAMSDYSSDFLILKNIIKSQIIK